MIGKDDFNRTEKSIANAFTGVIGQIVQYIFHYAVRTVFIYSFDKAYLGLNGLFTNIISILNLAELGIGTAIIYQLYESIAKKDREKIKQYLAFYKKVYRYIGFIVLGIGLAAVPVLPYIIKEKLDRINIYIIYMFYLSNVVFSYWFFAYRNAIVTANQEQYKTLRITYLLNIINSLIQIFSMILFKSIYAFLLIPISTTIISNLVSGVLIGKWYPLIRQPAKGVLNKAEVKSIVRNVYSLMLHKFSYIVLNSTDDVVLSTIAGITVVGVYSNYTLVVGALLTIIGTMFVSMTASIGNLNILGTKQKKLEIYRTLNFAHFWLYGLSSIMLYILLTPFITLWIGEAYLLSELTMAIICINYLTKGLRQGTNQFLHACGLFYESRLAPVVASILNIILSISLVKILLPYNLGVAGVLIGTIISELTVTWWYDGRLVNKRVFNISPSKYYIKYWEYFFTTIVVGAMTKLICSLYQFNNLLINMIYMTIVSLIVVNLVFYLIYGRSSEFKYIFIAFKGKVLDRIYRKSLGMREKLVNNERLLVPKNRQKNSYIKKIELLRRENVRGFDKRTLLITGGTGSFGNAVMKRFLDTNIGEIRIFSRDEKKQDDMRRQYNNDRLKFYIGDVRDLASVKNAMHNVDYIFHAAALKQVPSCEFFPLEAVKTNILGTDNVLSAAIEMGVKKVICLSTDKAAYPINAMGISKAMMEKVFVAKSKTVDPRKTIICGTRYGNVMASRGSVIPLFVEQIMEGKPLTVTDTEMTRFLMSLEEAVDLVIFAFSYAQAGDIMVQKSPACTIGDLALAVKQIFNADNEIKIIGTRHGEKSYETLLTKEEYAVAIDLGKFYQVTADKRGLNYDKYFTKGRMNLSIDEEYNSQNTQRLTIEQIKEKLLQLSYIQSELKKKIGGNE